MRVETRVRVGLALSDSVWAPVAPPRPRPAPRPRPIDTRHAVHVRFRRLSCVGCCRGALLESYSYPSTALQLHSWQAESTVRVPSYCVNAP